MIVSWNKSPRGIVIALIVTVTYILTITQPVQIINEPLIISD